MISPSTYILEQDPSISFVELQSGHHDSHYGRSSTLSANEDIILKTNTYYNLSTQIIPNSEASRHVEIYNDYLSILETENYFNDIIFPGLRYASEGVLIFERPPTHKVFDLSRDYQLSVNSETRQAQFYLPIPWQVYIAIYNPATMRLVSVKMFFTSNSLVDLNQEVSAPPLYNFYSNGTLCRPMFENIDDIEKYPKTYSGVIASAYDWIWNSGFNFDITENISHYIQSKNFYSFLPFLKSPAAKASFKSLVDNPLSGIPKTLDFSYAKSLYNCWQDIELKDICSVTWSPYTYSDFYYLEREFVLDTVVDLFLQRYNLSYCTCECEGCSEHGECCTNYDWIHPYDVHQDPRFNEMMSKFINKDQKPLILAYKNSILFLNQHKMSLKPYFRNKAQETFVRISEKFQITS